MSDLESAGGLIAGLAAAAAVLLARSAAPRRFPGPAVLSTGPGSGAGSGVGSGPGPAVGPMRRLRWVLAALGAAGGWAFVGGPLGVPAGAVVAVTVWVVIGRSEEPAARRERLSAAADLPHLVLLLAAALRSGAPADLALRVACSALPGGAARRLDPVRSRLELGVDPIQVWGALHDDPVTAPLARAMSRAGRSGAPVAEAVDRLAADLAEQARHRAEDRARTVGVRAALPLGLCLLPAFLLLGIVPVVAGLFAELTG